MENIRVRYMHLDNATEDMQNDTIIQKGEVNGGLLGEEGSISKVYVGSSGTVYEFISRLSWDKPRAYRYAIEDASKLERFSHIA